VGLDKILHASKCNEKEQACQATDDEVFLEGRFVKNAPFFIKMRPLS
jgi:hypothetical protein